MAMNTSDSLNPITPAPNQVMALKIIRLHLEQNRFSDALECLKEYGRLYAAYALAEVEKGRTPQPGIQQPSDISVGRLLKTIIANDVIIRNMRHRDARWHDDPDVQKVLEANTRIIQAGSTEPVSVSLEDCAKALFDTEQTSRYPYERPQWSWLSDGIKANRKAKVKIILDAAGVPYV